MKLHLSRPRLDTVLLTVMLTGLTGTVLFCNLKNTAGGDYTRSMTELAIYAQTAQTVQTAQTAQTGEPSSLAVIAPIGLLSEAAAAHLDREPDGASAVSAEAPDEGEAVAGVFASHSVSALLPPLVRPEE